MKKFPSPPGTFLLSIGYMTVLNIVMNAFPSPPGTFLLSIKVKSFILREWFPSFRPHRGLFFYLWIKNLQSDAEALKFPSPPGTFLLSINICINQKVLKKVSVPTGDFSFIYHFLYSFSNILICFRPHRGLFFYLYNDIVLKDKYDVVSVPTGDFSFIYPVLGTP